MDSEQQSGKLQRKSQLEWTACASTRPPPQDAETVRLDHFLFAFRPFRFLRRHWRGCGWCAPAMFVFTRDTFSTSFSIVVWGRAGIQFTPAVSRVTMDSASTGISASGEWSWFPFQRRVRFQKARTQIRNLESFQVKGCRMERYKDRDHAFLVGMLFVLMFLWLSAFVCICFVCLSPFVSDGPSVCLCPSVSRGLSVCFSVFFCAVSVRVPVSYIVCELVSLSAQCALETVVVLCCLGLPCPILSWFVLSGSVSVSPV